MALLFSSTDSSDIVSSCISGSYAEPPFNVSRVVSSNAGSSELTVDGGKELRVASTRTPMLLVGSSIRVKRGGDAGRATDR
jgi:hypothetical protein